MNVKDGCIKQIAVYRLEKETAGRLVTDVICILKDNQAYEIEEDGLFHSAQEAQYTNRAAGNLLKEIPLYTVHVQMRQLLG